MTSCRVRGCDVPPGVLVATVGRQRWHFCLGHFWLGVHKLLNRGADRVIVTGFPSTPPLAVSLTAPGDAAPDEVLT